GVDSGWPAQLHNLAALRRLNLDRRHRMTKVVDFNRGRVVLGADQEDAGGFATCVEQLDGRRDHMDIARLGWLLVDHSLDVQRHDVVQLAYPLSFHFKEYVKETVGLFAHTVGGCRWLTEWCIRPRQVQATGLDIFNLLDLAGGGGQAKCP